ncbi:MAG: DnaJ domain-containing protein [Cyanobacteriota bacterium]|nr:DnaJ domain-containing protein [Cyanobacteriota bacterium]
MAAPNHYQRLGLSRQASADELRQAFRRLSKRYHPDTTTLPPLQAAAAFCELQQAYSVLSDPERRRCYDVQCSAETAAPRAHPQPGEALPAVRRPLSGGEWLALLLLAVSALFSLSLGLGMAWLRGVDLMQWPSWWQEIR